MKRYIFSLLFSSVAFIAMGQQLFTSSLYDMQGNFHNPAMAGITKHGMIGVTYRSMWEGISGGPQTATVFGSAYIPKAKLGLGGYIYSDVTGPTKRIGLEMAYAYIVPLQNDASFSIGIEGRFQQFSFDMGKLQEALGSNDPVLGSTDNRFAGDAGLGFAYNGKKFQIGASVSQLIQSKLDFYTGNLTRSEEGKLYRHYYLHSKYDWTVDEATVITPNILFIYLPNSPMEVQGGVRVEHSKIFWWGVSYRARQSWMLSAGLHIKQKFTVGYSFDLYKTPLSIYDKGANANEIILRYDFLK